MSPVPHTTSRRPVFWGMACIALAAASCCGAVYALSPLVPTPNAVRPLLQVANASEPVRLSGLKVDGRMVGQEVSTTVEMTFHNPNNRVLEGELQFPLMPGQEVSGFALDIDGAWRDAVPVEKDKGRQVFDDVTRQRIDPALLEATQGNQFKLRVYPLPAGGQRRVRLTITERLQTDASGHATWRLNLPAGAALDTFSGQLAAVGLRSQQVGPVRGLPGTPWQSDAQGVHLQWQRSSYRPENMLEVRVALPTTPVVLTETRDGTSYFYAEVAAPQAPAAPRPNPAQLALVWDASGSGAARDHGREFALLDAYFKAIGNTQVTLTLAREQAQAAGVFRIENGNWQALRQALQAVVYDGATAAQALVPAGRADAVLLFSDGMVNYGSVGTPVFGTPVLVVNGAGSADLLRLQRMAHTSGGTLVDLTQTSPEQGAVALQKQALRLVRIGGAGISQAVASPINAQGRVAVAGMLDAASQSVTLEWQTPAGARQTQTIAIGRQAASSGHLAAGLWARLTVNELSAGYRANKVRITELGKQFSLVTKATSLIVLDRVEDYVRYNITPPEPLRTAFEQQQAQQKLMLTQDAQRHINDIARRFKEKQDWWRKDFPKNTPPQAKLVLKNRAVLAEQTAELQQAPHPMPAPAAVAAAATAAPAARSRASSDALKKADTGGGAAATSSIQLKKWQPDSPYARRLRAAAPGEMYAIYLQERPAYLNSTAFYLDAADIFFEKKQPQLALRILSNLAEMELENRHVLRILGYRLLQAQRADLAIPVLEKVLELAPDEPQSWRDVGLARAQAGQNQKAVDALYEVVRRPWHNRFPDIELIALGELNAIVANSKEKIDTSAIDPRLLKNLPLDVRAVLTWDADNTDIDLWVTDPNGEKVFYAHPASYQGGRISRDFTGGYGPEEFILKTAKPGKYLVQAQSYGHRQQVVAPATTLQLGLFTHFGKPTQKAQTITLRLAGQSEVVTVGEFVVGGALR